MSVRNIITSVISSLLVVGCYSFRPSSGGGEVRYSGTRPVRAADVALTSGYRIEPVAQGLTFPTGVAFDNQGRPYIVESGYSYGEVWTTPRLLRLEPNGSTTVIAAGDSNGPWNGVDYYQGNFYVAEGGVLEGGRILRITPEGKVTRLVESLPSFGDHHTNGPRVAQDGWVYFGQGVATNSGIVGTDNAKFGWLKRHPDFHDIPGADITLAGVNFTTDDPLKPGGKATTGAFVPFGTPTKPGQVIKGEVPCNGSIMRVRPDGGKVELIAWGFRNPYALSFDRSGNLYCIENGYDERGSRPVFGTGDIMWKVERGHWYGWPDYSGNLKLSDGDFNSPGGPRLVPLLAHEPEEPGKPTTVFAVHSSADGLDFSRNETFGFVGDAFVAQFGDETPNTGKVFSPVGFKVVRVDVNTGDINEFAVNRGRGNGPASMLKTGGLERPVSLRFTPDGRELYVVDFGVVLQTKEGTRPQPNTGVVWRITHAPVAR